MDDYYSINAILSENQKLTCAFQLDVEGLGYLEGGNEPNLKQHTKAELPFWLAQTLSLNEFTTFPIPQPYSNRVKAALNASAPSVKLSSLVGANGWWYDFGRGIASIVDEEQKMEILLMLLKAFIHRLPILQDLSAHYASAPTSGSNAGSSGGFGGGGGGGGGGGSAGDVGATGGAGEGFKEGMDGEERELFALGQDAGRRVKQWYNDVPNAGGKSKGSGR